MALTSGMRDRARELMMLSVRCYSSSRKVHPVTYPEDEYTAEPEYPPYKPPLRIQQMDKLAQAIQEMPHIFDRQRMININLNKFLHEPPHQWDWQQSLRAFEMKAYEPDFYNYNGYYEYLTKSRVTQDLPEYYDDIDVEDVLERIKGQFYDAVRLEWKPRLFYDNLYEEREQSVEHDHMRVDAIIHHLNRLVLAHCSSQYDHLWHSEVDVNGRTEAWWWRGGIVLPEEKWPENELIGKCWPGRRFHYDLPKYWYFKDSRLFWYKDRPAVQVRCGQPLAELVRFDSAESRVVDVEGEGEGEVRAADSLHTCNYDPYLMGLPIVIDPDKHPDAKWRYHYRYHWRNYFDIIGGANPGTQNEFGHVAVHNASRGVASVREAFTDQSEAECERQMSAHGVKFNHSWLLAQAYLQGFTQLHDLTYPLVTQSIVTTGQQWHFVVSQMNCTTLCEGAHTSPRCNLAWTSPHYNLFETDPQTGEPSHFNDDVLRWCLKFYLNVPRARPHDMKPYLPRDWGDYVKLEDRPYKHKKKRYHFHDKYFKLYV